VKTNVFYGNNVKAQSGRLSTEGIIAENRLGKHKQKTLLVAINMV
jgi:hypothetical protein